MDVIYEQHPVSLERKAELMGRGFKIIDARFAPDGYMHPDAAVTKRTKQPDPAVLPSGMDPVVNETPAVDLVGTDNAGVQAEKPAKPIKKPVKSEPK